MTEVGRQKSEAAVLTRRSLLAAAGVAVVLGAAARAAPISALSAGRSRAAAVAKTLSALVPPIGDAGRAFILFEGKT